MWERPREPSPPDLPDRFSSEVPVDLRATEVSESHLSGIDLSTRDATSLSFVDGRISDVEMSAVLRGATFRDCVVEGGNWANVDASESRLARVEIRGVRMTGAIFAGASISDVTFAECRLDLASFRFARMEGVRFDRCRLDKADLYRASCASIVFASCDLTEANVSEASFERCEMRGCDLEGIVGAAFLRGLAMPVEDVVRSAVVLAAGLGVRILDDEQDRRDDGAEEP